MWERIRRSLRWMSEAWGHLGSARDLFDALGIWKVIVPLPVGAWALLTSHCADLPAPLVAIFAMAAACVALFLAIFVLLFVRGWRATAPHAGQAMTAPPAGSADAQEQVVLLQELRRLRDAVLGYGTPALERDGVLRRIKLIEASNHRVWAPQAMSELRKDFLHACIALQSFREELGSGRVAAEASHIQAVVRRTGDELESRLSG